MKQHILLILFYFIVLSSPALAQGGVYISNITNNVEVETHGVVLQTPTILQNIYTVNTTLIQDNLTSEITARMGNDSELSVNDTTLWGMINGKAHPGACPAGEVVNETTTSGVVCIAVVAPLNYDNNITYETSGRIGNDTEIRVNVASINNTFIGWINAIVSNLTYEISARIGNSTRDSNIVMKNETNYFTGYNNTFNTSVSFGDEDTNPKTLWRYRAGDYPNTSDGFRAVYYPSFGDGPFDDWMVFEKTDGNDALTDGGIAFVMSNGTGANFSILRLDGYGLANFSDRVLAKNFIGDGSALTNLTINETYLNQTLNNSYIPYQNATKNIDLNGHDLHGRNISANNMFLMGNGSVNTNSSLVFTENGLQRYSFLYDGLLNELYMSNDAFHDWFMKFTSATNDITVNSNTTWISGNYPYADNYCDGTGCYSLSDMNKTSGDVTDIQTNISSEVSARIENDTWINNTQIADNITVTTLTNTKAYPGRCPNGQVVNETNTTGVVCVAMSGGDWSGIQVNVTNEELGRIGNDTLLSINDTGLGTWITNVVSNLSIEIAGRIGNISALNADVNNKVNKTGDIMTGNLGIAGYNGTGSAVTYFQGKCDKVIDDCDVSAFIINATNTNGASRSQVLLYATSGFGLVSTDDFSYLSFGVTSTLANIATTASKILFSNILWFKAILNVTNTTYTQDLVVINNATAKYFIGNGSLLTDINTVDNSSKLAVTDQRYNETGLIAGTPAVRTNVSTANMFFDMPNADGIDVSGTSNTLNVNTALSLSGSNCPVGNEGTCFGFDGTAGQLMSKSSPSGMPTGTGAFTISFWMRSDNTNNANTPFNMGENANPKAVQIIYRGASGLCFDYYGGTALTCDTSFASGTWWFLTAVYNGTHMLLYRNANLTGVPYAKALNMGTTNIEVGGSGSIGIYYAGRLDDVRLYSRALTLSEIQDLYTFTYVPASGGYLLAIDQRYNESSKLNYGNMTDSAQYLGMRQATFDMTSASTWYDLPFEVADPIKNRFTHTNKTTASPIINTYGGMYLISYTLHTYVATTASGFVMSRVTINGSELPGSYNTGVRFWDLPVSHTFVATIPPNMNISLQVGTGTAGMDIIATDNGDPNPDNRTAATFSIVKVG